MSLVRSASVAIALILSQGPAFPKEPSPCHAELARRLLRAIEARDETALRAIANNPVLFDAEGMRYLTADASYRFGRQGGRSAHAVLHAQRVLTKVDVREQRDGSFVIDVVYLPERTAPAFPELYQRVRDGRARLFEDYIACRFDVRGTTITMPHVCFAETDAVD